ncbi:uncharacterized protein LOC127266497 [Andrographis paniculata]|uniref:uncharacterized protein LOC127266497 n=1 Tax=Andrographis paniculata TaxID=175694 RepID=UPI0021E7AF16|nr:uncharacterized protein LOC127266497 [Andrographis paniculata]
MFKITSQLRHCGENISESDMMEKTLSIFHASNMVLQQQYRERGFQKYSELITCLLLAEQNNELLLKNHESRPTGANPFPDANTIQPANPVCGRGHVRNQIIDRDQNQNRGRGRTNAYNHNNFQNRPRYVPNRCYNDRRSYRRKQRFNTGRKRNNDEECTRCGIKGHWAHVCRTASHLAELYRASKEMQGRVAAETNHAAHDDTFDDVMNEKISHTWMSMIYLT